MSSARGTIRFLIIAAFIFALGTYSFNAAHAQKLLQSSSTSTVEFVKVHGRGLEQNLEGDSPDRDVAVLLPPSYATAKDRRYPVVYMLHGFTDKMGKWFGLQKFWINLPEVVDRADAEGTAEMIVVMPDAYTRYEGSMYSTSVTTGDWEGYIASELVTYIDRHYRTLARAESRGIAGHSLGGYGALRIGIRHPDVFSLIYAMSPCCLTLAKPSPYGSSIRTSTPVIPAYPSVVPNLYGASRAHSAVSFSTFYFLFIGRIYSSLNGVRLGE